MFDPLTLSIVIAYFLLRRGGENAIWAVRGGTGDPPSFRRWQTRQKMKAAAAKTGTGRSDARKFWSHLWQDAHVSAHEWRQRKHGRRWEDRKRRWQREDLERQQQRALAPCVFCDASRGEECRPGCPEREAHDADRATGGAPTVPPVADSTEPTTAAEPSHAAPTVPEETTGEWPTVPPAPIQPDMTVPPDRATGAEPPNRATSDCASSRRPIATSKRPIYFKSPLGYDEGVLDRDHPKYQEFLNRSDEEKLASKEEQLKTAKLGYADLWELIPPEERAANSNIKSREEYVRRVQSEFDELQRKVNSKNGESNVTPINKNQPPAIGQADSTKSDGGNMTTPAQYRGGSPAAHSGEFAGYEATVAGWETIKQLGNQLDAAYERQMAELRRLNADDQTIGRVASAREANENHMHAASAAKADWETRQGAVKETKDATGARGDEALHIN